MISVFSENPENDLWRELLQFSYEANYFCEGVKLYDHRFPK